MTIIAYKDGVMAADSRAFRNGRSYPTFPKIIRRADGALCGIAGKIWAARLLADWFLVGMPADTRPEIAKDDDIEALIVLRDGSVWLCYSDLHSQPSPESVEVIGERDAITFCEGALMAGLSAPDAVQLTVQNCVWASGEVQIERLRPAPLPAACRWAEGPRGRSAYNWAD